MSHLILFFFTLLLLELEFLVLSRLNAIVVVRIEIINLLKLGQLLLTHVRLGL